MKAITLCTPQKERGREKDKESNQYRMHAAAALTNTRPRIKASISSALTDTLLSHLNQTWARMRFSHVHNRSHHYSSMAGLRRR